MDVDETNLVLEMDSNLDRLEFKVNGIKVSILPIRI